MKLVRNTRKSNADNLVMVSFYKSVKHEDEKADADREIKIANLNNNIAFNETFIKFICG